MTYRNWWEGVKTPLNSVKKNHNCIYQCCKPTQEVMQLGSRTLACNTIALYKKKIKTNLCLVASSSRGIAVCASPSVTSNISLSFLSARLTWPALWVHSCVCVLICFTSTGSWGASEVGESGQGGTSSSRCSPTTGGEPIRGHGWGDWWRWEIYWSKKRFLLRLHM